MIIFKIREVIVKVPDNNYLMDCTKVEILAYLAERLVELIPGTYAEVDLLFNVVSIIDILDRDKKISFGIVNEDEQIFVKYDDLLRNAVNIIRKYKTVFLTEKGDEEDVLD